MFNSKKYRTLTIVLVIIIGLGLVMAYVPLLFLDTTLEKTQEQQLADLLKQAVTENETNLEGTTSTETEKQEVETKTELKVDQKGNAELESFTELEKEQNSLNNLDRQLE